MRLSCKHGVKASAVEPGSTCAALCPTMAMPTELQMPMPRGPVVTSMPSLRASHYFSFNISASALNFCSQLQLNSETIFEL